MMLYIALLLLMFFLALWAERNIEKNTCSYCGEVRGHDVHCPLKDVL